MAASAVFGGEPVWWSDIDPAAIAVMTRHTDAPNLGDIRSVNWMRVEPVDVLTAGYPCQPYSQAGHRRGQADERDLWRHVAPAIGALLPLYVVLENVPGHLRLGFDTVLGTLTALGYDTAWNHVRACDIGAPHRRTRLFVVAEHSVVAADGACGHHQTGTDGSSWWDARDGGVAAADAAGQRRSEGRPQPERKLRRPDAPGGGPPIDWGQYEPAIRRWERILGRPAPYPAATGPRGGLKVAPAFAEWLMGLDTGHVTNTPDLSMAAQLRLLGNGVVPWQAQYAIAQNRAWLSSSATGQLS